MFHHLRKWSKTVNYIMQGHLFHYIQNDLVRTKSKALVYILIVYSKTKIK